MEVIGDIKNIKSEVMFDDFIIARQKVEIWTKGVLEQINRIKIDCLNMEKSQDYAKKWEYNVLRINDDHFLKISINNAVVWLEELNKYVKETKYIYEELSNIQEIKDLRNMAEHEISYYRGNGHKQDKYLCKEINLTASETGILDGEYLIGGRLSLSCVEAKFKQLDEIIYNNNFTMTSFYMEKVFEVKMS